MAMAASRGEACSDLGFLSAQLSSSEQLPLHKDKNNHGKTWLTAFGSYSGEGLWIESPIGTEPSPRALAKEPWQKNLRGDCHNVCDQWLEFDPTLYHCLEPSLLDVECP